MYTEKEFLDIRLKFQSLSAYVGAMARELAKMRGDNTKKWQFEKYELESAWTDVPEPDIDNYFIGADNNCHYETGNTFEEDMKKWQDSHNPAMISACFYLGYECEFTNIAFPLGYLFIDCWKEVEQAALDEAKRKAEEAREQAQAEIIAIRERRERADYERLKAKFGS